MTRREAIDILFDIVTALYNDVNRATDDWFSDADRELPEEVSGQGPRTREEGLGKRPPDYLGTDPVDSGEVRDDLEETFPAREQGEASEEAIAATRMALKQFERGRKSRKKARRRGKNP